jgi:hypothetical protein
LAAHQAVAKIKSHGRCETSDRELIQSIGALPMMRIGEASAA